MSNDFDARLEGLLTWTLPHINEPLIKEPEAAPPLPLPAAVQARVLAETESASQRLLADKMLAAANAVGETRETLLEAAGERREEVAQLLEGAGNPKKIGATVLAHLFGRLRLLPLEWRELIIQAVARSAVFYPEPAENFGVRALAGSGSELIDEELTRNMQRAKKLALDFAAEVEREWQRLV